MKNRTRLIVGLGPALAAGIVLATALPAVPVKPVTDATKELNPLQEDVIVKPGGGGKASAKAPGLEWREAKTGRLFEYGLAGELRNDITGSIDKFQLVDANGTTREADWVKFTVVDTEGPLTIKIEKSADGRFKWTYTPQISIKDCQHGHSCDHDGIPKRFMGTLDGPITGQYSTKDADGPLKAVPVPMVKQFRLLGL